MRVVTLTASCALVKARLPPSMSPAARGKAHSTVPLPRAETEKIQNWLCQIDCKVDGKRHLPTLLRFVTDAIIKLP